MSDLATTAAEPAEFTTVESGTIALLARAEVDVQIATAKKYPRSLQSFRQEAMAMVTLTEGIAAECIYALPRDGKVIEGPSARFAEIIASAWGNCRSGARIVNEGPEFITAQGVFHDLQRNNAITYEQQRRITTSKGRRYGVDMIGVTGNAACSIALRNAILKGVPKAFWADMYDAARRTAMGDVKTLVNRRAEAIKVFQGYGVTPAQIFAVLEVRGEDDITLDHLLTLRGMATAIKEGDTTPEQVFGSKTPPRPSANASPPRPSASDAKPDAKAQDQKSEQKNTEVDAFDPEDLFEKWCIASQGASSGEDVEALWNELVGPHEDRLGAHYEKFRKVYVDRSRELEP